MRRLAIIAVGVLLTGCADKVVADGACLALRPQFPFQAQPKDTDATKRKAYTLNTAYDAACNGVKP